MQSSLKLYPSICICKPLHEKGELLCSLEMISHCGYSLCMKQLHRSRGEKVVKVEMLNPLSEASDLRSHINARILSPIITHGLPASLIYHRVRVDVERCTS